MTETEMKQWVDNASYEQLLSKWRFAPLGDPMFTMEMGEYYQKVMMEKRNQLPPGEVIAASKRIGWDKHA